MKTLCYLISLLCVVSFAVARPLTDADKTAIYLSCDDGVHWVYLNIAPVGVVAQAYWQGVTNAYLDVENNILWDYSDSEDLAFAVRRRGNDALVLSQLYDDVWWQNYERGLSVTYFSIASLIDYIIANPLPPPVPDPLPPPPVGNRVQSNEP